MLLLVRLKNSSVICHNDFISAANVTVENLLKTDAKDRCERLEELNYSFSGKRDQKDES